MSLYTTLIWKGKRLYIDKIAQNRNIDITASHGKFPKHSLIFEAEDYNLRSIR
jgi:hypothetical protein